MKRQIKTPIIAYLILATLLNQTLHAQPVITALAPPNGPVGSSITINGSGFSNTPSNNTVYFGSAKGTVSSASASSLSVVVPTGFSADPLSVTTGGLTAYAPSQFVVTYAGGGGVFTQNSFAPNIDINGPTSMRDIRSADINGDDKPELVVLNNALNTVTIYQNACSGTNIDFSVKTEIPTGAPAGNSFGIAVDDIDGDGKKDIAIAGVDRISVLRNTSSAGGFSFAPAVSFPAALYQYDQMGFHIAELNGDGKPEIIGNASGNIAVLRNNSSIGAISFAPIAYFPCGNSNAGIMAADVNADSKAELLTGTNGQVSILENISSGGSLAFAAPVFFGTFISGISLDVGDLDGDGKPDIALANGSAQSVSVLKNTGTGNSIAFGQQQNYGTPFSGPWKIKLADMNGDGKLEMCCSSFDNFNTRVTVIRNQSTGNGLISFASPVDYNTAGKYNSLTIVDFTNDGILDIAVANNSNPGKISLLRGKAPLPPDITSFSPTTGSLSSPVTIKGVGFSGLTSVTFGGVPATAFTVLSDTTVTATLGAGASGQVKITGPTGSDSMAGFVFMLNPAVTSLSAIAGPTGDIIKITGANFSPVASSNFVYFGGAKATVQTAAPNALTVTVPQNAMYSPVSVSVNNLTAWSAQPYNVTFNNGSIAPGTFTKALALNDGNVQGVSHITQADFDGDGLSDIVISSGNMSVASDNFIGVLRNLTNNGKVAFAPRVNINTNYTYTEALGSGDFNGDGKIDVVVANKSTGNLSVFRNISVPGNISFAPPISFLVGQYPTDIAISDIDGDSKADIVVTNNSSTFFSILRNTSSASTISFQPQITQPVRSFRTDYLCIGDADGDGKPDIFTTTGSDSIFSFFRNTSSPGSISFATRTDYFAGHKVTFPTMADIDGDGKQDVMMATINIVGTTNRVIVFRNNSTPGNLLLSGAAEFISLTNGNITVCDVNGDGRPDLVSAGMPSENLSNLAILQNSSTPGNISFVPTLYENLGSAWDPQGIISGDLDTDGKPDVALVDHYSGSVVVLINQNSSELVLCPNGNKTITSNVTGNIYQWQVDVGNGFLNITDNINYVGTNSQTLQLLNVPSSWQGRKYRCVVDNSKNSKTSVLRFANQWTGAVNTAWEVPGNWSCGTVPDINTHVVINSGQVVVNSSVSIKSLKVSPDVSFTVAPGNTVTVTQ